MNITREFEVARPIDIVWEFFHDVPSVAQCFPGAKLVEDLGDGRFAGSVSIKLGPMSITFEGEAQVVPDAVNRTGVLSGTGVDRRGGSRGQVKVDYRVDAADSGTGVTVDADITLSGPAAQFGRSGLINELSTRLIVEFIECMEKKLEAATPEEAAAVETGHVKGIPLLLSSLGAWIVGFFKRLFGQP